MKNDNNFIFICSVCAHSFSLLAMPPRFCALHAHNKIVPVNIWQWTCLRDSNRLFLAMPSFLFIRRVEYIGIASFNGQQFQRNLTNILLICCSSVGRMMKLLSFHFFIFICKAKKSYKESFFIQNDHDDGRWCWGWGWGEEGHLNFYSCILEIDCLKYIILKWAIKLLLSTPLNLSFILGLTMWDEISWIFEAICMELIGGKTNFCRVWWLNSFINEICWFVDQGMDIFKPF